MQDYPWPRVAQSTRKRVALQADSRTVSGGSVHPRSTASYSGVTHDRRVAAPSEYCSSLPRAIRYPTSASGERSQMGRWGTCNRDALEPIRSMAKSLVILSTSEHSWKTCCRMCSTGDESGQASTKICKLFNGSTEHSDGIPLRSFCRQAATRREFCSASALSWLRVGRLSLSAAISCPASSAFRCTMSLILGDRTWKRYADLAVQST